MQYTKVLTKVIVANLISKLNMVMITIEVYM